MAPNNSASTEVGIRMHPNAVLRVRPLFAGEAGKEPMRADIAAIEVLTDAYDCIQQFMAMETDPEDAPDLQAAQAILDSIESLIEAEAQEPNDGAADPGMGGDMGMNSAATDGVTRTSTLPRENIVRTVTPGCKLRSLPDGTRTLAGHFTPFNQWTEIASMWEGNFMERIAPGAFKKTFRENADTMKVLFQHGQDPVVGDKPLGPIRSLKEDEYGAAYEVDLLDTGYVRELIPGLEKELYGASFRFKVIREDVVDVPDPSPANPKGLPERTIREAKVMEFGPVTFPAYVGATAGVRSQTDEFYVRRMLEQPEQMRALLTQFLPAAEAEEGGEEAPAPTEDAEQQPSRAAEPHLFAVRRDNVHLFGMDKEDRPKWQL